MSILLPFLEKLDAQRGEEVKIVKVNVDENSELADKYEIESIPTLILFKDGKLVKEHVGFMSAEELAMLVPLSQVTPGPIAVNAATYVAPTEEQISPLSVK